MWAELHRSGITHVVTKACQELKGVGFVKVHEDPVYRVYRVTLSKSARRLEAGSPTCTTGKFRGALEKQCTLPSFLFNPRDPCVCVAYTYRSYLVLRPQPLLHD